MGTQKKAPKKVFTTFFPYIFHVKPKWNIVYEYLKTKFFSRDSNILPQMHWASNIFDTQLQLLGFFGLSLTYPILNFKKTVCPKNVWMQHCNNLITLKKWLHYRSFLSIFPAISEHWQQTFFLESALLKLEILDYRPVALETVLQSCFGILKNFKTSFPFWALPEKYL